MEVFEKATIGICELPCRIIRSATYEGGCSEDGVPEEPYYEIYRKLSAVHKGLIITGFTYIDKSGKAMQKAQAGLESSDKISYFQKLTSLVHDSGSRIFIQLAHTGRQTVRARVSEVVGASDKKSMYFKASPRILKTQEIYGIAEKFAMSAAYAKQAGFDGVQIHAAHGYLAHQFLLASVNDRRDEFGIDPHTGIGSRFLQIIIEKTRETCGDGFPVAVKISGGDDYFRNFKKEQFVSLIRFLDKMKADAIEISYGTMDYALNIMRGDIPFDLIAKVNPVYGRKSPVNSRILKTFVFPVIRKKIKPFAPMYNLEYALLARKHTTIPLIVVGGFRKMEEIEHAVHSGIDFVSMCRPFISEPGIVVKYAKQNDYIARCTGCNYCTIMCDSGKPTKCYQSNT